MIKWLGRLIALVVLLVVLVVGSLLLLPGDRLAKIASDQLTRQLGRDVTLSGDVGLSFYPVLGLSTGPIRIANADWAGDAPLLSANSARLGVDAASLLAGEIKISMIEADTPNLRLETAADGRENWAFSASDGAASSDESLVFTLDRLKFDTASVAYVEAGNALFSQDNIDISLRWPDRSGPADLDVTLRPSGQTVSVAANLAQPLVMMAGGAGGVAATVTAPSGKVTFNGRAGLAGEAAGNATFDMSNTGQFLAAFGLGGIEIPKGAGQAIKGSAQVTLTREGVVAVREADVTLDQNRIKGQADVFMEQKLRVNAQITSDALDFSTLAGADEAPSTGWSTSPIDASGLAAFDGEISLVVGGIDLGTLTLGKTRVLMRNDTSRAVFELREVQAYDGVATGEFVANNRNGLSVGGKLNLAGLELKTLLNDAMGSDRFSGALDAQVGFLGVGQSVDKIMKSLKGDGAVKAGPGRISGIDLDKLVRQGGGAGGTTVFDQLTGTFTMANGVLRNDDLVMGLPNVTATGEGKIDLGNRSINYQVTPTSLTARDGRGLAIPVDIQGPWADPKISADLKKAIDMNLAEEKKELENKVRDKVNDKLQEELGVRVEEGETLQESLEDKLKEEAKKGLLNLLNK